MSKKMVYVVIATNEDGVHVDGVYSTFREADNRAIKLDCEFLKENGSMEGFSGYTAYPTRRTYK